jgi:hypothetical protein
MCVYVSHSEAQESIAKHRKAEQNREESRESTELAFEAVQIATDDSHLWSNSLISVLFCCVIFCYVLPDLLGLY